MNSFLEKARALANTAAEKASEATTYVVGKATPLANSAAENLSSLAEHGVVAVQSKIGVLVDPAELDRLRRIETAAREVVAAEDYSEGTHTEAEARFESAIAALKTAVGA